MRFVGCVLPMRKNDVFHIEGFKIKADRQSTDGYGVLAIFEAPTKLDIDFRIFLAEKFGPRCFAWFPSARELDVIKQNLDLSDRLTMDWLRQGKGWTDGPRPFPNKIEEFV